MEPPATTQTQCHAVDDATSTCRRSNPKLDRSFREVSLQASSAFALLERCGNLRPCPTTLPLIPVKLCSIVKRCNCASSLPLHTPPVLELLRACCPVSVSPLPDSVAPNLATCNTTSRAHQCGAACHDVTCCSWLPSTLDDSSSGVQPIHEFQRSIHACKTGLFFGSPS